MNRIPKILHYVFGMDYDFGGKPWSLVHHVCLRSAIERIKPERVLFHYEYEPKGPWWSLSRELVTPMPIKAPREIFGRPLKHVAHRSDVVRLRKLIEHGGIYLDADVFVQRDFGDLLDHSAVLGKEGEAADFGVANAVILAEPNSKFLIRWLDQYRSFRSLGRDEYWCEHSVKVPAKLAKIHPSEITLLPHTAFFWPLWTEEHLDLIFSSSTPIPLHGTYANHLWETRAWRFLQNLTPGRVRSKDTNFHLWARRFVSAIPDNYGAPSAIQNLLPVRDLTLEVARRVKRHASSRLSKLNLKMGRPVMSKKTLRRKTFQDVYKHNRWGRDGASTFFSGVGSRGTSVDSYVERMTELLRNHAAELGRSLTVVDLGCGDFRVGHRLVTNLPDLTYIGCDIVPELIAHNNTIHSSDRVSFRQVDIVSDDLPEGDVCLVRQVLQHLPNSDIRDVVNRLNYRFIYVTEGQPTETMGPINPDKTVDHEVRFDWRTGRGRGVELDQPPYCLRTEKVLTSKVPPAELLVTVRVLSSSGIRMEQA
jgi:hypothetical protein